MYGYNDLLLGSGGGGSVFDPSDINDNLVLKPNYIVDFWRDSSLENIIRVSDVAGTPLYGIQYNNAYLGSAYGSLQLYPVGAGGLDVLGNQPRLKVISTDAVNKDSGLTLENGDNTNANVGDMYAVTWKKDGTRMALSNVCSSRATAALYNQSILYVNETTMRPEESIYQADKLVWEALGTGTIPNYDDYSYDYIWAAGSQATATGAIVTADTTNDSASQLNLCVAKVGTLYDRGFIETRIKATGNETNIGYKYQTTATRHDLSFAAPNNMYNGKGIAYLHGRKEDVSANQDIWYNRGALFSQNNSNIVYGNIYPAVSLDPITLLSTNISHYANATASWGCDVTGRSFALRVDNAGDVKFHTNDNTSIAGAQPPTRMTIDGSTGKVIVEEVFEAKKDVTFTGATSTTTIAGAVVIDGDLESKSAVKFSGLSNTMNVYLPTIDASGNLYLTNALPTTADAANVVYNTTLDRLHRSTSSMRYKVVLPVNLARNPLWILDVRNRDYQHINDERSNYGPYAEEIRPLNERAITYSTYDDATVKRNKWESFSIKREVNQKGVVQHKLVEGLDANAFIAGLVDLAQDHERRLMSHEYPGATKIKEQAEQMEELSDRIDEQAERIDEQANQIIALGEQLLHSERDIEELTATVKTLLSRLEEVELDVRRIDLTID